MKDLAPHLFGWRAGQFSVTRPTVILAQEGSVHERGQLAARYKKDQQVSMMRARVGVRSFIPEFFAIQNPKTAKRI